MTDQFFGLWYQALKSGHCYDDYLKLAYVHVEQDVEELRKSIGDSKADQLLEMVEQAKAHHREKDVLGTRLLQDLVEVSKGEPPFAYPKRLYRWPRPVEQPDSDLIPLSQGHAELFRELQLLLEMHHEYPGQDFSRDREQFRMSIRLKRGELDEDFLDRLSDMMSQAEGHYDEGNPGLGHCLMMDIKRMLCGLKVPFSYPPELFKWPPMVVRGRTP